MKIPKEKPRPEKTGDSKTPRERVEIFFKNSKDKSQFIKV
jgi:hypothetical protein